ncbi:MAG: uroporphyrinogen decarboxylase [Parvibaculales bacterium]
MTNQPPPIWLMRQAGRYLPEYRATREQAGGFLDLCYAPDLAEEVTLQPIRRFDFDAAILFADILLIPQALGQELWFETGEGPRLSLISNAESLSLDGAQNFLAPVFDTVRRLSQSLPQHVALIGFAGAPWTVASYMVAGRGTPDQAPARHLAHSDAAAFQSIIDVLVAATIDYLAAQVAAGAEVLQIFESWAASLLGDDFERWCVAPMAAIIAGLRARGIKTPIIAFPRAAKAHMGDYCDAVKCDGLGLDTSADIETIRAQTGPDMVLQGNLDPMVLVEGGEKLEKQIALILQKTRGTKHIFNLGHGIVPQTPPEHVARLIELVRGEN